MNNEREARAAAMAIIARGKGVLHVLKESYNEEDDDHGDKSSFIDYYYLSKTFIY